jgi:hypothetical protein
MVYLAAENQPEGTNPFRLEKERSRSGWEIAIVQGGQRFVHHIVVHVRTLFGGDASNNPRFIYAAFHFSKRRVVIISGARSPRPIISNPSIPPIERYAL